MSRILRNVSCYRTAYRKMTMMMPTTTFAPPSPSFDHRHRRPIGPPSPSFDHHHLRHPIGNISFRFYSTPSSARDPPPDAVQLPAAAAGDNVVSEIVSGVFATKLIPFLLEAATYLGAALSLFTEGTNKLWAIGVFVTVYYNVLKYFKKPDGRVIVLSDNHLRVLFTISKNVCHGDMVCHIRDHSDVELVCPSVRFWHPSVHKLTMPLPLGDYTRAETIAVFNAKTRSLKIDVYNFKYHRRWPAEKESPQEDNRLVAPETQLLVI